MAILLSVVAWLLTYLLHSTGAIAGAAWVLGKRAITDLPTAAIAAATLALLFQTRRLPEPLLIVAAGVGGVLIG